MRHPHLHVVWIAAAIAGLAAPIAAAQTLQWDALGSAGGRAGGGGTIALSFTAGQFVTGRSASVSLIETVGFWHPPAPNVTGVEPAPTGAITAFGLVAIVPNPSANTATVTFTVPTHAVPLIIEVMDLSGRVVRVLASGTREAGRHSVAWDGRAANGSPSPSGIYFCRLQAGAERSVRRLALVR